MRATSIGIAIVLAAAGAVLVAGYPVAATVVGLVGGILAVLWPKVLGKLGVRSSR